MPVPELHLQDRLTRLSLAPTLGASLINWQAKASGQALLRHSDSAALASGSPRRLSCYLLAPWSNRIAEGGFQCPDGWLALAPNTEHDPYPIHGSAWQQPWQVDSVDDGHARLSLDSQVPFAYRATLDVRLDEGCLTLELEVTHLDPRPTWHGLGFHPYFPRFADTRLLAPAQRCGWVMRGSCPRARPRSRRNGVSTRCRHCPAMGSIMPSAVGKAPAALSSRRRVIASIAMPEVPITTCCTAPRTRGSSASSRSATR